MKENKLYFSNRSCNEYRDFLKKHLILKGVNGLIKNAINHPPEIINGKSYSKTISIDFTGVSASTLLDGAGSFINSNIESNSIFEDLLKELPSLNKKGIKLRFRALLVYPYSDYAFSRIQAESTDKRATISRTDYTRNFELIDEVKEKTFYRSTFYSNQVDCLAELQRLIKKYDLESENDPNKIRVKFSTVGSSLCLLFVNNIVIYDPYILAKESNKQRKLVVGFPVTVVRKPSIISDEHEDVNFEFESLRDHWRFLWTHDTTLFCQDATQYNPETMNGLDEINPPHLVDYESKSQRILYNMKAGSRPDDTEIKKWKFRVQAKFELSTRNIISAAEIETVFITCSWKQDKRKEDRPNIYAEYTEKWLKQDLGVNSQKSCLEVSLVRAQIGETLHSAIYKDLNRSSLAIIIISKDINDNENGKWYAKPNIYHELGYLQNKFSKIGKNRKMIIMIEKGVEVPSNIRHLTHLPFERKNFNKTYLNIISWLRVGHISSTRLDAAEREHKVRLADGLDVLND